MPLHVCNGATLKCPMAVPPGTGSLIVLPINRMLTSNQPAANIMDYKPILNIPSFGMCQSPSNPLFIAATAAALGTPTPVPCVPITLTPWTPGAASPPVLLANMPALDNVSTLTCMMGGVITIVDAGQETEFVP